MNAQLLAVLQSGLSFAHLPCGRKRDVWLQELTAATTGVTGSCWTGHRNTPPSCLEDTFPTGRTLIRRE